ncbi:MAG: KH domain-containing protein [Synergistetes bacterium]|nr:KH domain-containing protein [Synergistota bacterium]
MKELAEFLIEKIVKYPDRVSVDAKEEGDKITIDVKVAEEDIGRVIGRRGRMVQSLTQILRMKGLKIGKRVVMRVEGSRSGRDRKSGSSKYTAE